MHPDQLEIDPETAAVLVEEQFPQWRGLPVRPVSSAGTVHSLFRLGSELVLRFPLQPGAVDATRSWLLDEAAAARRLLGRVPVPTPTPVALGEPGHGFPLPWMVYSWLAGTVATDAGVGSSADFARDLAELVLALRRLDIGAETFRGAGRGGRLPGQDDYVASCLRRSRGLIDVDALARLWSTLRNAPRAGRADVATHGDLMPGNLLVLGGRLTGVIDVGGLAPADPALDLMPAWNLLSGGARSTFRHALVTGDEERDRNDWDRGRGWAFAQAIGCLYYYRETNPVMSGIARRTLEALLEDAGSPRLR